MRGAVAARRAAGKLDQFAALINESYDQKQRQRLLEQMNRRVNLMGPPGLAAPAPLHVTLSFGGVTYPDGGADAAELYRKADGMLYLSKRQGRNRCTFWNPHGDALVLIGPPASAS